MPNLPTLHQFTRTPLFRALARALVFLLVAESFPFDAVQSAHAQPANETLWVDARGVCGGQEPCFTRIQAAIDAVQPGQTIQILPGEYVEQLKIRLKNGGAFASEADRITIEADPASPVGSVVLRGSHQRCEGGYGVDFDRSKYVTLRGLVVSGAGERGVILRGGARQNRGIRLERNELFGGGTHECTGGVDVGLGNPDTVIANNLLYANGRNGLRFRDGTGGSYLVVENTIVRNGWNGIYIKRTANAHLWNNIIAFNGTAPGVQGGGRFGLKRPRIANPKPQDVDLRDNLICGNKQGEIDGPVLDAADQDNQTPTGSEGPGVVASASCAQVAAVFANLAGHDGQLDTGDDEFTLASGSPAIDRGLDPRAQGTGVPAALFEADYFRASVRPQDGDGNEEAAFDIGAVEQGGRIEPTPAPSSTPTATPTGTPSSTPAPTSTPTPTATPSSTPTPSITPTATPTHTFAPTPTPTVIVPPTATPTPTPTPIVVPPTATPTVSPTATSATPTPTLTSTPAPTRSGVADRPPLARANTYTIRADQTLDIAAPGVLGNDSDPDHDPLSALKLSDPALGTLSLSSTGGFSYTPTENVLTCDPNIESTGVSFVEPSTVLAVPPQSSGAAAGLAKGDFNHDGALDLAVTLIDLENGILVDHVLVMLGNGDGTFQAPVALYSVAHGAQTLFGLLAKDFDGDGELDLLAVESAASRVLFFKGHGNGTFDAAIPSSTTLSQHTVQAADLDGDGALDLVVASFANNTISRLFGNGDGTFQLPTVIVSSDDTNTPRVALGDVNGDGAPDVVFSDYFRAKLGVLLNLDDGSGGFQPLQTMNVGNVHTIFLADFDGDKTLDVALHGTGCGDYPALFDVPRSPAFTYPWCVAMLHGNGDGTFDLPTSQHIVGVSDASDNLYTEATAPDVDGDGLPDVIIPSASGFEWVTVGLNAGDGTFVPTAWVASEGTQDANASPDTGQSYAVLADDFTGDGLADIVGTSGNTVNFAHAGAAVSLLPAVAPGIFHAARSPVMGRFLAQIGGVPSPEDLSSSNDFLGLAVGDFKNDGKIELVAGAGSNGPVLDGIDGSLFLTPINADGTLGQAEIAMPWIGGGASWEYTRIRVADMDRDGNLDLVYVGINSGGLQQLVLVAYGDGAGHFSADATIPYPYVGPSAANIAVADFDGDGFPDIAALLSSGNVEIHLNGGTTRTFALSSTVSAPPGLFTTDSGIVAADFDGDGAQDLAYSVGFGNQVGATAQQSLFAKGHGDGTFDAAVGINPGPLPDPGGVTDMAAADLDHDGKLDLVESTTYGPAFVQLGNGNGTFQAPVSYAAPGGGSGTDSIAIADFDHDGNVDVAVAGAPYGVGLVVLAGKGDGTLADGHRFATGGLFVKNPVVADVNQDGKPDLIVGLQNPVPFATILINDADSRQGCRQKDQFTYRASDGTLSSNVAVVNLEILPVNHPPVITSLPVTTASVGQGYTYPVQAFDPDAGDRLAFTLITAPPGMTIDGDAGKIQWLPTSNQGHAFPVTVRVYDSAGAFAEQSYTVTARPRVTVPDVTGQVKAAAEAAVTAAGLSVGNETTTSSPTVPAGEVISQNPVGGTMAPQGSPVALVISTGPPGPGDILASIVVEPASELILVGGTLRYKATGVYQDNTSKDLTGVVTWSTSPSAPASVSTTGLATGLADGATVVTATSGAISGNADLTVHARTPGDSTPPIAIITSPTNDQELTGLTSIVGTATDDNFLKYELAYAPTGETDFTPLAVGTAPVTGGTLGQLDPTVLINDLYTVQLQVFDRGGNVTTTSVVVQVDREKKVGLFSITLQDLNIDLDGLPITINRVYDSRDKGRGDFGIGWRLDLQTLRLRTNRVLGTGWVREQSGAIVNLSPTDVHTVSLTLADGKVEEFDMNVSPTAGFGGLDFTTVTGFVPRPGTLGTLEALANPSLAIFNDGAEDVLVDDTTFNTYDPQVFRYTTPDGTQMDIDRTQGVLSVTDRNGNTLTFSPNGILHSSGKSVTFVRDAQGRITQITSPLGSTRLYSYDANGDLVTTTDFDGDTSRYRYNRSHGLLDIQDPLGNHAARNEYDAEGRLVATIDAAGNRIEFTHQIGTSQEIVRDRLGNVTLYENDANGNVVSKTDALGQVTTYTFDAQGNTLSETDPLGRTASKIYDARKNVLSSTDFDGNTTAFTFDGHDQLLTSTDPEGRTTSNAYDGNSNLVQVTDPEGGTTTNTYDSSGNVLSTTDPLGHTTTFTYDAFGHKLSATDPLGHVTTFAYDANGRLTSEVTSRSVPGGATETLTTLYEYDATGNVTRMVDPTGGQVILSYFPTGKRSSIVDTNGHATQFEYDTRGNQTKVTLSDGSFESTGFDAEGRVLVRTDRDGIATDYTYDALGRQTATTNADGTTATKSYDSVGRIVSQTDERGNTTTYGYAPNQQVVTDALGQSTTYEFDSQGHRKKMTDALGHVFSYEYDSVGNLTRTVFPDNTEKTATYDLAHHKTAETDQAGNTAHFAYDAVGRLISVTDAAGEVTLYAYDEVGNRIGQTDANGHTTLMEYDRLGRLTKRVQPLGKQEAFTYDGNGDELSHTDFNGETITSTYDTSDRLSQRTLPGGVVVAYDFSSAGRRTQAGDDLYEYDVRGRLVKETKASGAILTYTYDAVGNRTSLSTPLGTTTYTYDVLNRLLTTADANGTTTQTYDATGNLASTTYPNGVTTAYAYDSSSRLVQLTNTGPGGLLSSYDYTLGAGGNRLQVTEAGSATTARTVSYAFDAVYRLTSEQIDEPGTVNDQAIAYTYDPVGNRTSMDRSGIVTTYAYDAADRLLTETIGATTKTLAYDANGNLLSQSTGGAPETYVYDAQNRLVSADTPSGAASYTYDADGIRTSKTAGAQTTTFLVDKNREFAQVVVETTGASTVEYTYGTQLISETRSGTGAHFYLSDGQLSTRQLTTIAGAVSDTYTYDAFGVLLGSTGSTPNEYQYTGEQFDANLGFYYLRARYYAPEQGRFITTDPEQGSIFDPMSLHRYLYANANPVDNRDPSGRSLAELSTVITIISVVGAALAGVGVTYVVYRATGNIYIAVIAGVLAAIVTFYLLRGGGLRLLVRNPAEVVRAEQEYGLLLATFQSAAGRATTQAVLRGQLERLAANPRLAANMLRFLPKVGVTGRSAVAYQYVSKMIAAAANGSVYLPPIF